MIARFYTFSFQTLLSNLVRECNTDCADEKSEIQGILDTWGTHVGTHFLLPDINIAEGDNPYYNCITQLENKFKKQFELLDTFEEFKKPFPSLVDCNGAARLQMVVENENYDSSKMQIYKYYYDLLLKNLMLANPEVDKFELEVVLHKFGRKLPVGNSYYYVIVSNPTTISHCPYSNLPIYLHNKFNIIDAASILSISVVKARNKVKEKKEKVKRVPKIREIKIKKPLRVKKVKIKKVKIKKQVPSVFYGLRETSKILNLSQSGFINDLLELNIIEKNNSYYIPTDDFKSMFYLYHGFLLKLLPEGYEFVKSLYQ